MIKKGHQKFWALKCSFVPKRAWILYLDAVLQLHVVLPEIYTTVVFICLRRLICAGSRSRSYLRLSQHTVFEILHFNGNNNHNHSHIPLFLTNFENLTPISLWSNQEISLNSTKYFGNIILCQILHDVILLN